MVWTYTDASGREIIRDGEATREERSMSATVFSVRIFDGEYETDVYPTREQAEAHVARSVAFAEERGIVQAPPVIVEVESSGEAPRMCKVCGEKVVTSENPEVEFCKSCFYVGAGYERARAEQMARFEELLPGVKVRVDHTGGGCFWLALQWEGDETFYALTDGEAGLPTDDEGRDVPDGGWGYVGRLNDDDSSDDYEGTQLFWNTEALTDPSVGLSDAQAAAVVVADRSRRGMVAVGTRVRLVSDVERYPHFIAPEGSTGAVVDVGDPDIFAVRLDDLLPGAETWENEVHFMPDEDVSSALEVEVSPSGPDFHEFVRNVAETPVLDRTVERLAGEIDRMLEDWRAGRNASPDERDYVLTALRLLEVENTDSAVVEAVANRIYESPMVEQVESSTMLAALVVAETLEALKAPKTARVEGRQESAPRIMHEATVLPLAVSGKVAEIAEDACQAAFALIAARLELLGFPVTGDVDPGESVALEHAFQGFVLGMALNNPAISRMNYETV